MDFKILDRNGKCFSCTPSHLVSDFHFLKHCYLKPSAALHLDSAPGLVVVLSLLSPPCHVSHPSPLPTSRSGQADAVGALCFILLYHFTVIIRSTYHPWKQYFLVKKNFTKYRRFSIVKLCEVGIPFVLFMVGSPESKRKYLRVELVMTTKGWGRFLFCGACNYFVLGHFTWMQGGGLPSTFPPFPTCCQQALEVSRWTPALRMLLLWEVSAHAFLASGPLSRTCVLLFSPCSPAPESLQYALCFSHCCLFQLMVRFFLTPLSTL